MLRLNKRGSGATVLVVAGLTVTAVAVALLSYHPQKPRYVAPVTVPEYSRRPVDRKLVDAAGRGDLAMVRRLLEKGSNPNAVTGATDGGGPYDAFEAAASYDHLDVLKLLVSKGGQINAPDCWGCTALVSASAGGYSDEVQWLIDNGADLEASDDGTTALDFAIRGHHADVERILRKAGAPSDLGWPFW